MLQDLLGQDALASMTSTIYQRQQAVPASQEANSKCCRQCSAAYEKNPFLLNKIAAQYPSSIKLHLLFCFVLHICSPNHYCFPFQISWALWPKGAHSLSNRIYPTSCPCMPHAHESIPHCNQKPGTFIHPGGASR